MDRQQIVLASRSPRRAETLRRLGLTFLIEPTNLDESALSGGEPEETVLDLARAKARTAWPRHPDDIIVAADTIVVIDGMVLRKPRDDEDAKSMLRKLSGRAHEVLTGIAVINGRLQFERAGAAATEVNFRPMTEREIEWYAATGEPRDKAGAYAIQGLGGLFVETISGNYDNVVGFPLTLFARLMEDAGVSLVDLIAAGEARQGQPGHSSIR